MIVFAVIVSLVVFDAVMLVLVVRQRRPVQRLADPDDTDGAAQDDDIPEDAMYIAGTLVQRD